MKTFSTTQKWRVNGEIRAGSLRVIGDDGKQVGVMPVHEAVRLAREKGLDLIEIAPKANPPVAKITDFGKFRYQEEKKLKEQKKKAKQTELKEIRFSPFIAEGDYRTRLSRAEEFLTEGNKVKVVVVFKGRHLGSKQFGYDLMKRVLADLEHPVVVDMEPKFLGRHLAMVVSPVKKVKKENAENKNKEIDK